MSGKQSRKRRTLAAKEAAQQAGVPCLIRQRDHNVPPCKVHRDKPKITEQIIKDIAENIGLMRQAALRAALAVRHHPAALDDVLSMENAALQMLIIQVGESAKRIDQLNCTVLREIDWEAPWADIKGARDFLGHNIDPNKIAVQLLAERIQSYFPFLLRMPAIICYAQPTRTKSVNQLVTDLELVQALHKEWGGIVSLRYLRFLETGECYSYTFASGSPNQTVRPVNTATGEELPDAVMGVLSVAPDITTPHTLSAVSGDGGNDMESVKCNLVVLRQTPLVGLKGEAPV